MILRYRWYRVQAEGGNSLGSAFAENLPQIGEGWFARTELPDGSVGFSYLWESNVVVNRMGSLGEFEPNLIPSIFSVQFSLTPLGSGRTLLRITEPGRNVRPLLRALELAFGYGFTCSPIILSDFPSLSIIEAVDSAALVGLKLTNVSVRPGLIGRMELVSNTGILDGDLEPICRLAHKREQVTYSLVFRGLKGQLTYGASGLVRIGGQLSPRILGFIESDIRKFELATT